MPPFASDGKYRPDLSSSTPQLLPPPRRNQPMTPQIQHARLPSAGQTQMLGVIRDNRSQTDLRASPSPFGQPVLGMGMSADERQAEVWQQQQQPPQQAVLAPVRRGGNGVGGQIPQVQQAHLVQQVQQPAPGLVARHSSGAGSSDFNLSPSLMTMPPPEYQRDPS